MTFHGLRVVPPDLRFAAVDGRSIWIDRLDLGVAEEFFACAYDGAAGRRHVWGRDRGRRRERDRVTAPGSVFRDLVGVDVVGEEDDLEGHLAAPWAVGIDELDAAREARRAVGGVDGPAVRAQEFFTVEGLRGVNHFGGGEECGERYRHF